MSRLEGEALAAWLRERAGKLTASRMRDAMAVKKDGKPTAERAKLMRELLAERLAGDSVRHFVNDAMQWGLDHEDDAKAVYEAETGNLILDVGFFNHPTIDNFGATPDGRIDDGLIETKCPNTTTHIGWIIDGVVPEEHKPQMIAQMLCTDTTCCDFVSYDPRMKKVEHRLFVVRFTPTQEERDKVEMEAVKFLRELDFAFDLFVGGRKE